MPAIVSATDGKTPLTANLLNQYRDTFNNVLGITDTEQDALGRLVLPRTTLYSSQPTRGEWIFDTNSWARHPWFNDGINWIPIGVYRNQVSIVRTTDISIGTSMTTVLSGIITTTGGGILVMASVNYQATKNSIQSGAQVEGELRLGTGVLEYLAQLPFYEASSTNYGQFTFFFYRKFPAGSYSFNVRCRRQSNLVSASTHTPFTNALYMLEVG